MRIKVSWQLPRSNHLYPINTSNVLSIFLFFYFFPTADHFVLAWVSTPIIRIHNSPTILLLVLNLCIYLPDNAIPIKSWFSDPSDTALLNLLPMLDALR